ncbi:MAG TPA: HD domain-containing phosphohydrolase [Candidatus Dormibacteraeota bacterium]
MIERRARRPDSVATLLVVGDDATTGALTSDLSAAGHHVVTAQDGASALRQLSAHRCDLVLCDATLPDMDGLEVCRAIKAAPATMDIPVVILADEADEMQRQRAISAGADDHAVKPIGRAMVLALVKAHLLIGALNSRLHELEGVIVSLARVVDERDPTRAGMSERVAHWAMELGAGIGLPDDDLTLLYKAALLHDVGTVGVPVAIFSKTDRLSATEFDQVRQHPIVGEQLLQALPRADRLLPAIRHHHEWADGRGYPDGLKGDRIPLFARIIAIADAFTALNSDRPYRRRLPREVAIRTLRDGAGTQWDPDLVARFLQLNAATAHEGTGEIQSTG